MRRIVLASAGFCLLGAFTATTAAVANPPCPKTGCPAKAAPPRPPPVQHPSAPAAGPGGHQPGTLGAAPPSKNPFATATPPNSGASPFHQSPFTPPHAGAATVATSSPPSTGSTTTAPRRFDSAASTPAKHEVVAGSVASAPRRFGGVSAAAGTHAGAPVRSASGHPYMYHGQRLAPFRVAHYAWPPGYRYQSYAVGTPLPHVFWVHQYFITNYADYGVDAPDPGFTWIRYGPDLLLIDLGSGQVASVVPGVFDESGDAQQAVADPTQGDGGQQ